MIQFLLRRRMVKWYALAFLVWWLASLWPVRWALNPTLWTKTHLVLLTNEAEARPCGGFVSAYGVARALPPRLSLDNVYNLPPHDLGPAKGPLKAVATRRQFWDEGTRYALGHCADDFKTAYKTITNNDVDRVAMVDIGTLESVLEAIGPVSWNGRTVTASNVFATLSRTVADTDRHDEASLATRKAPLGDLAKAVIKRSVLRFWHWRKLGKAIDERVDSGQLYIETVTPNHESAETWAAVEWNLGGAKSSRYLQKGLTVAYRQTEIDTWVANVTLRVRHAGDYDEPLSQEYKGGIELVLPAHMEAANRWVPLALNPGETYEYTETFTVKTTLPDALHLRSARGQRTLFDVTLTALSQQSFRGPHAREGVIAYGGMLESDTVQLDLSLSPDGVAPFVTLHESISLGAIKPEWRPQFAPSQIIAEVHFSEPVSVTQTLHAELLDRDVADAKTHTDAYLDHYAMLPDGRGIVLGFTTKTVQKDERYTLLLEGLKDRWGNDLSLGQRTIIHR